MHTVEAADSSTSLRSAQNDSAHLTFDLEVTHDVLFIFMDAKNQAKYRVVSYFEIYAILDLIERYNPCQLF